MDSMQSSACQGKNKFVQDCRIPTAEMTTKGILVLSDERPQPIPWIAGGSGQGSLQACFSGGGQRTKTQSALGLVRRGQCGGWRIVFDGAGGLRSADDEAAAIKRIAQNGDDMA